MCRRAVRRGHRNRMLSEQSLLVYLFIRFHIMPQFRSFEDIEAWKEARKLLWSIRQICKRDSAKRDFNFIDQITSSARSISANIAEGNDAMTPPEFIQFLGYAKRSSGETRSHLYDALDEKYISQDEFTVLSNQTIKIAGMIAGLIHYLQSLNQKMKRTYSLHSNKPINE